MSIYVKRKKLKNFFIVSVYFSGVVYTLDDLDIIDIISILDKNCSEGYRKSK